MNFVAAVAAMVPVARPAATGYFWAVFRSVDLRPIERAVGDVFALLVGGVKADVVYRRPLRAMERSFMVNSFLCLRLTTS